MICPFCKSKNVEESVYSKYISSQKWVKKDEYPKLYNCNDCGYHGKIYDLLEMRNNKLRKIKNRI